MVVCCKFSVSSKYFFFFLSLSVSVCLRLTESSAGVAEQLASTQRMAEDLVEAQSAALKSQETILRNGEELKTTLQHSAKGKRVALNQKEIAVCCHFTAIALTVNTPRVLFFLDSRLFFVFVFFLHELPLVQITLCALHAALS